MTSGGNGALDVLGDRGRTVDGAANAVRGRTVEDSHGDHYGRTPYREPRYAYPANLGVLSPSASRMQG